MSEQTQGEKPDQSQTTQRVLASASFLLEAATAMQRWSGHLDWSRRLASEGVLKNRQLKRSFHKVKRRDFLPEHQQPDEGYDWPLEIGYSSTNSQPSMVAQMLELLQPQLGQAILDVGAGSGWSTGLLAAVVGKRGRVVGTERVPELVDFARGNLAKYEFPQATVEQAGPVLGMPSEGPYNRILVSAQMIEDWIPELSSQLSPRGGIMVAPIATKANYGSSGYNQSIDVITRHGPDFVGVTAMTEVGFVPLIHDEVSA